MSESESMTFSRDVAAAQPGATYTQEVVDLTRGIEARVKHAEAMVNAVRLQLDREQYYYSAVPDLLECKGRVDAAVVAHEIALKGNPDAFFKDLARDCDGGGSAHIEEWDAVDLAEGILTKKVRSLVSWFVDLLDAALDFDVFIDGIKAETLGLTPDQVTAALPASLKGPKP